MNPADMTPPCPHGIELQALSALRDGMLDPASAAEIRDHVGGCPVCQQRLADLDRIARSLRDQPELEPGQRVWQGIQAQLRHKEPTAMVKTRRPVIGGIAAVLTAALLVTLFVVVLHNRPGLQKPGSSATMPPQGTVTATTTSVAGAMDYTVDNPALAAQLTFAFIKQNEVWISVHGAAPQQLTHLNLPGDAGCCQVVWSPDQSRILLTSYPPAPQPNHVWIVTVPGGVATEIPTSKFLIPDGYNPCDCVWVDSRYLLYISEQSPHSQGYSIFDTQTQTVVPSPLDKNHQTQVPLIRNGEIYYTSPKGSCNTTEIDRYDIATRATTVAFTLPGSLSELGIQAGAYAIAADGQSVVMASVSDNGAGCSPAPGFYPIQYQRQGGEGRQMFASVVNANTGYAQLTLAPDGSSAMILLYPYGEGGPPTLDQQPVGSNTVTTLQIGTANDFVRVFGWLPPAQGIVYVKAPLGNGTISSSPASLYFVPAGSSAAPTLIGVVNTSSDELFPAPLGG